MKPNKKPTSKSEKMLAGIALVFTLSLSLMDLSFSVIFSDFLKTYPMTALAFFASTSLALGILTFHAVEFFSGKEIKDSQKSKSEEYKKQNQETIVVRHEVGNLTTINPTKATALKESAKRAL